MVEQPPRPLTYDEPGRFALDLYDLLAGADDIRVTFTGGQEDRELDRAIHDLRRALPPDGDDLAAMLDIVAARARDLARAEHATGVRFGSLAEAFRAGLIDLVTHSPPT